MYRSVKGLSGFAQLGVLMVCIGVGLVLSAISQFVVYASILIQNSGGINMDKLDKIINDPAYVNYNRVAQVIGTFFIFFIPAYIFTWICNGSRLFWLGFNKFLTVKQIITGFLIILFSGFLFSSFEDLSKIILHHLPALNKSALRLEEVYNTQVKVLSNLKSWNEYITALFIMAFFPAMFEEIFFRGVLQQYLSKWWERPFLAIVITSVFFSLIHFSIYLFITRFLLGCSLGLMFYYTKNIWVNIIAHFLNNALALTQLFILALAHKPIDSKELDPHFPWWGLVITAFLLVALFVGLRKISAQNAEVITRREKELINQNNMFNPFDSADAA